MKTKQLEKGRWSKSIIYFYSIKNKTRFWCESNLERDALLLLEFDDSVEAYKAQPLSIAHTSINQKPARYTPDQLIRRQGEKYFFREVKPESKVDDALKQKIAHLNEHTMNAYSAPLEIITDAEIRVGANISNLNILYSYKRVCIDHVDIAQVARRLPAEFIFSALREVCLKLQYRDSIPFALLAHGVFKFDIYVSINENSIIRKI
jgi:hypothetical protein